MFKFLKSGLLAAALLFAQPTTAADLMPFNHETLLLDTDSHTYTHIAELEPIPNSYQLAKATFLPEATDDFGFSGSSLENGHNQGDNCDGYPFSVCPTGGSCSSCPFNHRKLRVTGCRTPYLYQNGNCNCPAEKPLSCANDKCTQYCGSTCIAKSCSPTADQSNCTNGTQACDDGCCGTNRKCCIPCTDKITDKPTNSSYTYSSCTDGSGSHSIQTGWKCDSGYHQSGDSCIKNCTLPACSGISSKPGNSSYTTASCTDCSGTKTINTGWTCNSGYVAMNSSCVPCTSSLTFRTSSGYTYTAKQVIYNGFGYSVVNVGNGITCKEGMSRCAEGGYTQPDYNFAKYLIANKSTTGVSTTNPTCSSTQCGTTQYLNCTNETDCTCKEYSSVWTGINLCVKPLCTDASADSCPSGYQLNKCSSNGYEQTGTTPSSQGYTCYKCEYRPCSDIGGVSSCPSGQSGTPVTYAGRTCYTNCKDTCSYQTGTCGSVIPAYMYNECVKNQGYTCYQVCVTQSGTVVYQCHH